MATPQLPMPTPTVPRKPLLTFKLLSFDIYGTLIDWETSVWNSFQPLLNRITPSSPHASFKTDRTALARLFNDQEHKLQAEQPTLRYDRLLREIYMRIARELDVNGDDGSMDGEAAAFGESVGRWEPFPDTVDACQRLAKYYKLVPLSNVDRASFTKTCTGPLAGVDFWRIYVAEEIGSYKPSLANFHYLIDHVQAEGGVSKDEILHTAQSLMHDHVPAKVMGMSSAWIARKGAGMGGMVEELHERGEVGYGWRFASLGEMADAVEREAAEKEKEGRV